MTSDSVDPELGLLQLPGGDPSWLWAFTCPTRGCSCRRAVVLAAPNERELLRARGAPVGESWRRRGDYASTAAALPEVTAFELELDTATVSEIKAETPLTPDELAARPELRRVVEQLDGELLDAIGRLWYLGKQTPVPEDARREAPRIEVVDWKPGELVSWLEVMIGVRDDLYIDDDDDDDPVFEALDLYCVAPGCTCGEVRVQFLTGSRRDPRQVGTVHVTSSGVAALEPDHARERTRLERLWAAFRRRHPRHRERFARRAAAMQEIGPRIVPAPGSRRGSPPAVAAPKVGRNEPCPCGSGKKHKKCCGAA